MPPGQIPACGIIAPGSCLGSYRLNAVCRIRANAACKGTRHCVRSLVPRSELDGKGGRKRGQATFSQHSLRRERPNIRHPQALRHYKVACPLFSPDVTPFIASLTAGNAAFEAAFPVGDFWASDVNEA